MFNKLKSRFFRESEPKVIKLDSDTLKIIKYLSEAKEQPDNISMALDLSTSRIKYEIKQLENKNI